MRPAHRLAEDDEDDDDPGGHRLSERRAPVEHRGEAVEARNDRSRDREQHEVERQPVRTGTVGGKGGKQRGNREQASVH